MGNKLSPMMQQYFNIKEQNKDTIIMFRLGDFYEMFFDDALIASKILEITLTGRDCGLEERAPMCGVPYHSATSYIAKLIESGHKVGICEQLEDPATTKGLVKRDIVRIITPGTVIENNMLEDKKNNYIMSILLKNSVMGISVCDVSTGELYATKIDGMNTKYKLIDEIAKYMPTEIITNEELYINEELMKHIKQRFNTYIAPYDANNQDNCENLKILSNEDVKEYNIGIEAANILLDYLKYTQKVELTHINSINIYSIEKYMQLDSNARRNLEITETIRDKSKKGSLLWVLDKTKTPMGGRMLKKWVENPLINVEDITYRLDGVEELKDNVIKQDILIEYLNKIYDIERLVTKIVYGNVNARELVSLRNSLEFLPNIKNELSTFNSKYLIYLYNKLDDLKDMFTLIDNAIIEDPPVTIKEGGIIKSGYSEELDEYRRATTEGKKWIIDLEIKEKERTGIKGLKTGYNRVFGYYFEITKSNYDLIPDRYIRKQTLSNCERVITNELKEIEEKILGAQEKIVDLEYEIFTNIRGELLKNIDRLKLTANIIATLDALISFSQIANDNNYVRPIVNKSDIIDIKNGRHPVVEKMLPSGSFVQNDTYLNLDEDRFNIITGPNMAGKSTYMRQVALITLMSQIGSFVPADYAEIGIADKIFTRVGAADDLASGQSTFMVEMMEVADILNNATNRSLIILDEIGRGTSTFDGLSIAWATTEYICDKEKIGARTLFATHYHELTQLEDNISGVKNYSVAVKDKGEDVIFLRKIIRGGTDQSYGIHVAKLAGVPKEVLKSSKKILKDLVETDITKKEIKKGNKIQDISQYDLFNYKAAQVAQDIEKLDLNDITPVEALNLLYKFKEQIS
ncbi:MAG: DNA mismatch repair protein MutS [Clostridiales bacterium]|nr:DNA mismatch repair protein MutS [Clostridiales bacterium]